MNERANRLGLLVFRFVLAMLIVTVLVEIGHKVSSALPTAGVTLYVVPVAMILGFMPLLFWYRRDAYPVGLLFAPVTHYWLRFFASVAGLER
ncbi:MAG: hypothetical protein ACKOEC_04290 [Acidimicrobiia bacterium]